MSCTTDKSDAGEKVKAVYDVETARAEAARVTMATMALNAPIALMQMEPDAIEDLGVYLKSLSEAVQAKDHDKIAYLLDAINDVFSVPDTTEGPDVDGMLQQMRKTPEGAVAVEQVEAENEGFMTRYVQAKTGAGLQTQREVAERCGVSKTTVNAIETERVAPQFRTVERLAKGLGVTPEWLLTGRD